VDFLQLFNFKTEFTEQANLVAILQERAMVHQDQSSHYGDVVDVSTDLVLSVTPYEWACHECLKLKF
jgi:hypothetical protein